MNHAFVSGWVGGEPVHGQTNKGVSYANFSIGVMTSSKAEKSFFLDCVAYDKTAEQIKAIVGVGDFIAIDRAKLIQSEYKNKEGVTIRKIKILVNGFTHKKLFMGKDSEEVQEKTLTEAYDEIPFST
jgi:single-stranded DNA-binding protein